ncbi:DUF2341 domain-containing protein [Patescibacteria group bacterium]|nr:DUF2341 domain-containing protein [Patescibacteria group bacterium]
MSFIKQISEAIREQKSCCKQDKIATHFLLVFGFALVGLSFLLYGAIGGQLARAQSAGWYNDGGTWGFRQRITVDPTKITGNVTDFPMLVQIADESNPLFGKALSNGQDIVFTSGDGTTKLDHEITEYSDVAGSRYLQAWVKVPYLSGFSLPVTSLYMYYGNPTAIDQQQSDITWSEYHLIQHMHDSGAVFEDKSPIGNDGTPSNVAQGVIGKIGKAATFNGTSSLINLGSSNNLTGDNLQTSTMSAWIKFSSTTSQYPFSIKRSASESSLISLDVNAGAAGAGKVGFVTSDSGGTHTFLMSPLSIYNDDEWHKLEAVVNGSDRILYIDGVSVATDTAGIQSVTGNTANAFIGAFNASQLQFAGQIDEVRFYQGARNANWIKTSYDNENDPATFISFSPEQELASGDNYYSFGSPQAGAVWYFNDSEYITFEGIMPTRFGETFPVSLSLCLTRPDLTDFCFPTPIVEGTFTTGPTDALFSFPYVWGDVGYLGGIKVGEDLSNGNAFITAVVDLGGGEIWTCPSDKFSITNSEVTIAIANPNGAQWNIGDDNTIDFAVNPITAHHYSIVYQQVGANDWLPIIDDLTDFNYVWQVPVVAAVGSEFEIKVNAHDDFGNVLGTATSVPFVIDYGPVASWNLEATIDGYPLRPAEGLIDTSKLSLDTAFTLTATAKDVHDNIITNQSDPINLGIIIFGPGGVAVSITPNSLGDGNSSMWNQGTASFDNYRFSAVLSGGTLPVTFNLTAIAPSEIIKIQLFEYGISVFEPNNSSNWTIGENRDIVFKFGGLAPTNPSNTFARFYYSQTGNWTTPYPVKDENNNDRLIAYVAGQQLINVPWLLPDTLDITKPVEIKAEFYDNNGTPADQSDDIILASDISDSFNIGGVIALEGTYVSAKFDISSDPAGDTFINFSDVNGFTATYNEDIDGHSDVEFSLSFFDSSDQLLGTAINPDGWFVLDDLDFDASMAVLNAYNWLDQIKQIQFRIKLTTDDYNSYSPYVEFLELSFEVDTAAVVGIMNFESGNAKSIARGSSADFGVRITITGGYEDQIGEIILTGEADDATITGDPVIITGTGAVTYLTNVSFDTTNLTTLGDHNISITAEVTGQTEMTFIPSMLTGILTVTDITAGDFSIDWVGGGDTDKTVQPGGIASYNYIISWDQNYTYDIDLTTTAPTVIGSTYIEEVEFLVDGTPSTRAVKPLVAPYTASVELQITIKTNSGEMPLTAFDIAGEGNLMKKTISPMPSLTISNQPSDVVIIEAKAGVEGGTAASFTSPGFTIRLYKQGTSIYTEKTGVLAVSKDTTTGKYLIKASFDKATTDTNGKVVVGTTYAGYLRSVRHLWRKAVTPAVGEITITAGTNSYTLEFPELIAGDIYPDNQISSFDFRDALANFNETLSDALNDFDNNGKVNAMDLAFVLINYFKSGDLLP